MTNVTLKATQLLIDVLIPDKIKDAVKLEHYEIRLGGVGSLCQIDPASTIHKITCSVPLNNDGSIRL